MCRLDIFIAFSVLHLPSEDQCFIETFLRLMRLILLVCFYIHTFLGFFHFNAAFNFKIHAFVEGYLFLEEVIYGFAADLVRFQQVSTLFSNFLGNCLSFLFFFG